MITHAHDRLIRLTSPHTVGPQVAALQRLMHAKGFFNGKIDSEYGPATARAVKQTKYLLGYPKDAVDMVAGDHLYGRLAGVIKATPAEKKLMAARKPKPHVKSMGQNALANAMRDLGYTEHPAGTNGNKFGVRYHLDHVAWCNIALSCWYIDAGSTAFVMGKRHHYVPAMVSDAERHNNGLTLTYDPQPGDPVAFDWNKDRLADHTGLFGGWVNRGTGTFWTIEGNTALYNDSNGGQVMKRERNKSQVRAFIHVLH